MLFIVDGFHLGLNTVALSDEGEEPHRMTSMIIDFTLRRL